MKYTSILTIVVLMSVYVCGVARVTAQTTQGVNLARLKGWDIVVADDAIHNENYAAKEYQELFRQASGTKLPIVHKIKRLDKHVFIGPGKVMQHSPVGFSVDDLGPEDLHILRHHTHTLPQTLE